MPERPVTGLTVLYDARCPLCRWVRGWLEATPQHVRLEWVPCGSRQARERFPWLDHDRTTEEVTVVGDAGQVWTAEAAWITCLWASVPYRGLAEQLARPRWRPHARSMALAVARTMQGSAPPSCRVDAGYRPGRDQACVAGPGPAAGSPPPDAATPRTARDYGGGRARQP